MTGRSLRRVALLLAGVVMAVELGAESPGQDASLSRMRREIEQLRRELDGLGARERGLLGELERLGAESRLREAELREISLRLASLSAAIVERSDRLQRLERAQEDRRRYLAFRLRQIYKAGPDLPLRRLLAGDDATESFWAGLRYAAHLSERDGRLLASFRADAAQLALDREELVTKRIESEAAQDALSAARAQLERARAQRSRLLNEVRQDQDKRRAALLELEAAAQALGQLVGSLAPAPAIAALDVRKFKGLLDWPSPGSLGAGFGTVVHPRFKTQVPHRGLDIEAASGADIRSIFDGQVVFADWMRGYGLTVIVDHGNAVLSIYSHASAILAGAGDRVSRGQSLGKVGDTGSLRGPFLYFELRVDGQPVDPESWLRPRGQR